MSKILLMVIFIVTVCGCSVQSDPHQSPDSQHTPSHLACPARPSTCDEFKTLVMKEQNIVTKQDFFEKFGKPFSIHDVVPSYSPPRVRYVRPDELQSMMQQEISSARPPMANLDYKLSDGVVQVQVEIVPNGWIVRNVVQIQ